MTNKANYVRRQPQTREHHCHWPGCTKQVPPAMWGCANHWYQLPAALRNKVWAAYQPGQEVTMTPSAEYLTVAREVEAWILRRHGPAQVSARGNNAPQPAQPRNGSLF